MTDSLSLPSLQGNGKSPKAGKAQAVVHVLTEEELAGWMRERGRRVIFSQGRFWADHCGFFRLLHASATVPADQLGRPSPSCWAFHVLLPDQDSQRANALYPLHLIRDLSTFDERGLDTRARQQLRRCKATLQVVRIDEPDLLRDQGWAIFSRNAERLGLSGRVTEDEYLAEVDGYVTDPRRLVLGAMDGNRLLAYLETHAVADTAYLDRIRLSDESRTRQVSGFLHYEASQLYRASGLVTQLCAGPPVTNRPGISEFKRRWGIPIVLMPAHFWSPAPFRALLRVARPGAYNRAVGLAPPRPGTTRVSSERAAEPGSGRL